MQRNRASSGGILSGPFAAASMSTLKTDARDVCPPVTASTSEIFSQQLVKPICSWPRSNSSSCIGSNFATLGVFTCDPPRTEGRKVFARVCISFAWSTSRCGAGGDAGRLPGTTAAMLITA